MMSGSSEITNTCMLLGTKVMVMGKVGQLDLCLADRSHTQNFGKKKTK